MRGEQKEQSCFLHYHNESFFGLAKSYRRLIGKNSTTWFAASRTQIVTNRNHIAQLRVLENREK